MARVLGSSSSVDGQNASCNQVHSSAVAELIKNVITPTGLTNILQGHTDGVSFIDPVSGATFYDDPCLLHLLLDRVNPSLAINVENLRDDIEKACLNQFSNNVDDLLTFIKDKYQKIQDMNKICESVVRYNMNALLSGPDKELNNYMPAIKGDIDASTGQHARITYSEIVAAARNKYRKMVAQGEYWKLSIPGRRRCSPWQPKYTHCAGSWLASTPLSRRRTAIRTNPLTTAMIPPGSIVWSSRAL